MNAEKQNISELARNRHSSRELALRTLYAHEINGGGWQDMLEDIAGCDESGEVGDEPKDPGPVIKKYAAKLLGFAVDNLESIDSMIAAKAANWELRRMAAVDRNVLRLASAELMFLGESVPYRVVIDEAVEIAKAYGTDDSGKFVNGILDSIRKEIQRKAEPKVGEEKA